MFAIQHAAADAGCRFWLDPALVHSGCCGRDSASIFVFFSYNLVPCRPFSVRFTSSTNFSCLDRIGHTDRTFHRVRVLTVPHFVCMFLFCNFAVRQNGTRYSDCQCYKIRSSEDSSACTASTRVPADPVCQSTGNGTSALCVQLPSTALQI